MKILGISSNYHDASASLVIDGKVISSSAEERFTYEKHDPSFPAHSISFCLKEAGINAQDLDYIVYHEDPQTKFTRTLASSFKNFPFSLGSFIKTAKDMISVGFWIKNDISKALDISPRKIIFSPHHLSHAAHAFFTSPYQEAAIMTIDAVGEWSTACIFHGKKEGDSFKIEPMDIVPFPNSLGLVYSAFTGFLGFKVNDGECSTMALAAFGKPTYAEQVRKIIKIAHDGTFSIDLSYFDFSTNDRLPLTEKFIGIFGKPRQLSEELEFSSFENLNTSSPNQIRYADIAASIQLVLEEAVVGFAKRAKMLVDSPNLCYAGGVALNCVANSRLVESGVFKKVYIPQDPGDGGGAMGAALYGAMIHDKKNASPSPISPYLGRHYPENADFISMVKMLDPSDWHRFSLLKIPALKKDSLHIREFTNDEDLVGFIAKEIAAKKIVGWVQGRFETGPRALGNRSILCRTDCIETARKLSTTIKIRSSFRPYACSILEEDAFEYLNIEKDFQLGSWMQSSFSIKDSKIKELKAAAHIDQTTRAQILSQEENPLYHKLIKAYKNETGIPALLNTSFNLQGFPMVSSPYDALLMMAKTNLDLIVVNRIVVSKRIE